MSVTKGDNPVDPTFIKTKDKLFSLDVSTSHFAWSDQYKWSSGISSGFKLAGD